MSYVSERRRFVQVAIAAFVGVVTETMTSTLARISSSASGINRRRDQGGPTPLGAPERPTYPR